MQAATADRIFVSLSKRGSKRPEKLPSDARLFASNSCPLTIVIPVNVKLTEEAQDYFLFK